MTVTPKTAASLTPNDIAEMSIDERTDSIFAVVASELDREKQIDLVAALMSFE